MGGNGLKKGCAEFDGFVWLFVGIVVHLVTNVFVVLLLFVITLLFIFLVVVLFVIFVYVIILLLISVVLVVFLVNLVYLLVVMGRLFFVCASGNILVLMVYWLVIL